MQNFFDFSSIEDEYDLVIIGGGPAGSVAALYASRDELKTLVVEKTSPGGQTGLTAHVDNHPGFPETISGMALAERYYQHAQKYGAVFRYGNCVKIQMHGLNKYVHLEGREKPINTKTVIIATGSRNKKLGIPGEDKFTGRGVSWCATCDGGFYKDKSVVAIGGGNAALEESAYLTRFAEKVYLVHRRDEFRGCKIAQRLAMDNPKVELVLNSVVTQINGEDNVTSVSVKNVHSGEITELAVDGVFIFIGLQPFTEPFRDLFALDEQGYIIANETTFTEYPGVFVAGDVRTKEIRQIATAVSDGAVAAKMAVWYLQNLSVGHVTTKNDLKSCGIS